MGRQLDDQIWEDGEGSHHKASLESLKASCVHLLIGIIACGDDQGCCEKDEKLAPPAPLTPVPCFSTQMQWQCWWEISLLEAVL